MRIQRLICNNFMGLHHVDLDLTAPLVVIAGPNESGKSSIHDAIRFALSDFKPRGISYKKDLELLVSHGARRGTVEIVVDDKRLEKGVATGNYSTSGHASPEHLNLLLDANNFADLSTDDRRRALIEITGAEMAHKDIAQRLFDRLGVAENATHSKVDEILPILRSGFDAGAKYAHEQALEQRGVWQATTGERYGHKKAEGWKPAPDDEGGPAVDPKQIKARIAELEAEEQKLDRLASPDNIRGECPSCHVVLSYRKGKFEIAAEDDDVSEAPEMDPPVAFAALKGVRERLENNRARLESSESATDVAKRAGEIHSDIMEWTQIKEALEPAGIPSEVLSKALVPIKRRLAETQRRAGWDVDIREDGEITLHGTIYPLLSRSAQWRCDAAIADALAHVSGIGVLLIDRFDVLDLPSRKDAMTWLLAVARNHNNVIVSGTLKQAPVHLQDHGAAVYWMEGGSVVDRAEREVA